MDLKNLYPVLPLRDIVVFPHMIVPLFVGRDKSVKALEHVMLTDNKHVLLVTQKNAGQDDPAASDIYSIGTLGTILQLLKLPDGTVKVLVEGSKRMRCHKIFEEDGFFQSQGELLDEAIESNDELEALMRTVVGQFDQYIKLNRKIPPDVLITINQIQDGAKLADTIASYLSLKIPDKQILLEIVSVNKRLEKVLSFIEGEISVLQVEKRIRTRVKKQMEKTQRDFYLNEQLKAIQKELGEGEDGKDESIEFEEKINALKLSKEAREKAMAELRKFRTMNQMSAEATVVRNYLDWILNIPWHKRSKIQKDLKKAEEILDRDHYGLEKVKERILEYLAVQTRVGKMKGQILCLVGPPGVGKTSLGKSIAEATGRNFVRVSLGGVRDESEIRGHRRTYIGSMPGRIIQGMRKAKKSNPLFLLDEIEKVGSDWRGDPASALLEVLDPEQNDSFADHYLEVGYDLSDVMFVTTANTTNMPQALLDRMEVIRIAGYSEDEKVEIAFRHLIPKQIELNGLKKNEFSISTEAMLSLIRLYTRESGVRSLEREIARLCRKAIKAIISTDIKTIEITEQNLKKYAGIPRYKHSQLEQENMVGVCTGLAWTEFGGEILAIEAAIMPGSGKLQITGKLGEVMQESVHAAHSYAKLQATKFGIDVNSLEKRDIHLHVPEGGIPKDGPSAGIAIYTALVSAITGKAIRKDIAMTGEITLRGRVLAIGGLKEKLLAARRSGINIVLIPEDNTKDLEDVPDNIKNALDIKTVNHADQVLPYALAEQLN